MNIIAVIVTYNRKELLREVLCSLSNQTRKPAEIIIIDNNSTDGTSGLIAGFTGPTEIHYRRLSTNVGGAGGFNQGISLAYARGADWIWCMDDDAIPEPDALEKLTIPLADSQLEESVGFLASRVLWTDRTPCLMNLPVAHYLWSETLDQHPELTRIVGASFVSILIPQRSVARFGLPVKEFFIWFDDAEYTRRISKDLPCYFVRDSVIIHKTADNIAPLDFNYLERKSLWKFKYGVRNECSFHRRTGGRGPALLFCLRTMFRARRARIGTGALLSIAASCIQGLAFNYLPLIEFPDSNTRTIENYGGAKP